MADDIDVANSLMDVEISRALSKLRTTPAQGVMGPEFCKECEDEMPEARRQLGFSLCIGCAEESERKRQLFGN